MSGDYRRFEMGDPLGILIAREERTCKGCIHKTVVMVVGVRVEACLKGRKLKRCRQYRAEPSAPSMPS